MREVWIFITSKSDEDYCMVMKFCCSGNLFKKLSDKKLSDQSFSSREEAIVCAAAYSIELREFLPETVGDYRFCWRLLNGEASYEEVISKTCVVGE